MSRSNVAIIDKGFDAIFKELSKANVTGTKVGLFAEDRSADGQYNMATLGLLQEEGGGKIPARDFMKSTAIKHQDDMGDRMEQYIGGVIDRKRTMKQALEATGSSYVKYTKDVITKFSEPPNAKYTIKKKGRNDPLVDTGKMRDSIKHKITGRV